MDRSDVFLVSMLGRSVRPTTHFLPTMAKFAIMLLALLCLSAGVALASEATASAKFKLNVCVGSQMRPACANGGVVNIVSAYWGREHTPSFGAFEPTDSYQCATPPSGMLPENGGSWDSIESSQCVMDVSAEMRALCHGRRSCAVSADPALLPDTCPSVWKYMTLSYTCIHEFPVAVCDGNSIELQCAPGQDVVFNSAIWGSRVGSSLRPLPACTAGLTQMEKLCLIDVTPEAQSQCSRGSSVCTLHANASLFGSPCDGVSGRFLEGSYSCRSRSPIPSVEVTFQRNAATVFGATAAGVSAQVFGKTGPIKNQGICFVEPTAHAQLTPPTALGDVFSIDASFYVKTFIQGDKEEFVPISLIEQSSSIGRYQVLLADVDDRALAAIDVVKNKLGMILPDASMSIVQDRFVPVLSTTGLEVGWHHLTLVRRGSSNKLNFFVDGVLRASVEVPLTFRGLAALGNGVGGASLRPFCGLGTVRVFDHALSATQMLDLSAALPLPFSYENSTVHLEIGVPMRPNNVQFAAGVKSIDALNRIFGFEALGSLPAGLHLHTYTGAISGTPTSVTSGSFVVAVRAYNALGSHETLVTFLIRDELPGQFQYQVKVMRTQPRRAVRINAPVFAHQAGVVDQWTVSPALPAGLKICSKTGAISGTVTTKVVSEVKPYTVTATNKAGSVTGIVKIGVHYDFHYGAVADPAGTVFLIAGKKASVNPSKSPRKLGKDAKVVYSIQPKLPKGLRFHSKTGHISGTAPANMSTTKHTVSIALDSHVIARAPIQVKIADGKPTKVLLSKKRYVFYRGDPIVPGTIVPSVEGMVQTSLSSLRYSIRPLLLVSQLGLSFDNRTGELSGTPSGVTMGTIAFNITAHSYCGRTEPTMFELMVVDLPPGTLSYLSTEVLYDYGWKIQPNLAQCLGAGNQVLEHTHAISFSIKPDLPVGMIIDQRTGAITGKPIMSLPRTAFTVRATSSGGYTEAVIYMTIVSDKNAAYTFTPLMFEPTSALQCTQCSASCSAHMPRTRYRDPSTRPVLVHAPHGGNSTMPRLVQIQGQSFLEVDTWAADASVATAEEQASILEQLSQEHFGTAYAMLTEEQQAKLQIRRKRSTAAELDLEVCECSGCSSSVQNLFALTGRLLADASRSSLNVGRLDAQLLSDLHFTYHAGQGGRFNGTAKTTLLGTSSPATVSVRMQQTGAKTMTTQRVSNLVHSANNAHVLLEVDSQSESSVKVRTEERVADAPDVPEYPRQQNEQAAVVRMVDYIAVVNVESVGSFDANAVVHAMTASSSQHMKDIGIGSAFGQGKSLQMLWISQYCNPKQYPQFAPLLKNGKLRRTSLENGVELTLTATLTDRSSHSIVKMLRSSLTKDAADAADPEVHIKTSYRPVFGTDPTRDLNMAPVLEWMSTLTWAHSDKVPFLVHPSLAMQHARVVIGHRTVQPIATPTDPVRHAPFTAEEMQDAHFQPYVQRPRDYVVAAGTSSRRVSADAHMTFDAAAELVPGSNPPVVRFMLSGSEAWITAFGVNRLQLSDFRTQLDLPVVFPMSQAPPVPTMLGSFLFGYGNAFERDYLIGTMFGGFQITDSARTPSYIFGSLDPNHAKHLTSVVAGKNFQSVLPAILNGFKTKKDTLFASYSPVNQVVHKQSLPEGFVIGGRLLKFLGRPAEFVMHIREGDVGMNSDSVKVVRRSVMPAGGRDGKSFQADRLRLDINVTAPFLLAGLNLSSSTLQMSWEGVMMPATTPEGIVLPGAQPVPVSSFAGYTTAQTELWGTEATAQVMLLEEQAHAYVKIPYAGDTLPLTMHVQSKLIKGKDRSVVDGPASAVVRLDSRRSGLLHAVQSGLRKLLAQAARGVSKKTQQVDTLRKMLIAYKEGGCNAVTMCRADCEPVAAALFDQNHLPMFDDLTTEHASAFAVAQQRLSSSILLELDAENQTVSSPSSRAARPASRATAAAKAALAQELEVSRVMQEVSLSQLQSGSTVRAESSQELRSRLYSQVTAMAPMDIKKQYESLSARAQLAAVTARARNFANAAANARAAQARFFAGGTTPGGGSVLQVTDLLLQGVCRSVSLDAPTCSGACASDAEVDALSKQLFTAASELTASRRELEKLNAAIGSHMLGDNQDLSGLQVSVEFPLEKFDTKRLPSAVDATIGLQLAGRAASFVLPKLNMKSTCNVVNTIATAVVAEARCVLLSDLDAHVVGGKFAVAQCRAKAASLNAQRPQQCMYPLSGAPVKGLLSANGLVTDYSIERQDVTPSRQHDLGVFYDTEFKSTCPASLPKTCAAAAANFLKRYSSKLPQLEGVLPVYVWQFYMAAPASMGLQWIGATCAPCQVDGRTPKGTSFQFMPTTCLPHANVYHVDFSLSPAGGVGAAVSRGSHSTQIEVRMAGNVDEYSLVSGPLGASNAVDVPVGGRVALKPAVPLGAQWTFDAFIYLPLEAGDSYQVLAGGARGQMVAADLSGRRLGMIDAKNRFHAARDISLEGVEAGWHRLTVTGSGGAQHFHLDGGALRSGGRSGQTDKQVDIRGAMSSVGNGPHQLPRQWRGPFARVRLWNRALTADQVALLA